VKERIQIQMMMMLVFVICCSDYSAPVTYTTAVAAPSQPDPPMLSEQFVSALTVSWIRRPGDDLFMLHMDDESKVRAVISCPLCTHMYFVVQRMTDFVGNLRHMLS